MFGPQIRIPRFLSSITGARVIGSEDTLPYARLYLADSTTKHPKLHRKFLGQGLDLVNTNLVD